MESRVWIGSWDYGVGSWSFDKTWPGWTSGLEYRVKKIFADADASGIV